MASDNNRGILFILVGMTLFSGQDVLIRQLSDGGSLLQVLTIRGVLGTIFLTIFLKLTGRPVILSSAYPLLSAARIILFFFGFLAFYYALTVMNLAEVTALFFASPLFITLISKFILKESVGLPRTMAVIIGFMGVLLIVKPTADTFNAIALLPIFTAFAYAVSMMVARYTKDKDSIWQQMMHLYFGGAIFGAIGSILMVLFAVNEASMPTAGYIVREWNLTDGYIISIMICVAAIGCAGMLLLTYAYRLGAPSVIAPFEYSLLFLAAAWGYFLFDEVPDTLSMWGMILIVNSSLFIFFRENIRRRPMAIKTSLRT